MNITTDINVHQIRKEYTQKAYLRLGIKAENWLPELGFKANLPILERGSIITVLSP
jgi:hypothetical protein